MPTIPTPETVSSLRRRYPAALREVYDLESVRLGSQQSPVELPCHTFPFHDGLTLFVSREDYGEPHGRLLNVSAMVRRDSRLDVQLLRTGRRSGREASLRELIGLAESRFGRISGGRSPIRFAAFSLTANGFSAHWFGPDPGPPPEET